LFEWWGHIRGRGICAGARRAHEGGKLRGGKAVRVVVFCEQWFFGRGVCGLWCRVVDLMKMRVVGRCRGGMGAVKACVAL